MGEALKSEVLERVADDIYNRLVSKTPNKRPNGIFLYGGSQLDLVRTMLLLTGETRRHRFKVDLVDSEGFDKIDLGERCLEKIAFLGKEKFYLLPPKERQRSIIVDGGTSDQRIGVAQSLREMTDVFVYTSEQFPDPNGEYVFDINCYFKGLDEGKNGGPEN